MDPTRHIDPELAPLLQVWPPGLINLHDIAGTIAAFEQMVATAPAAPAVPGIEMHEQIIRGPAAAPNLRVRIYRPSGHTGLLPIMLWIHGGGYVMGNIEQDDYPLRKMAQATASAIVTVDYRLAPAHPFPAALEDCYAALQWIAETAPRLGIDRSRIAIGGASAGAGLAAGLALFARDHDAVKIVLQLLIYPMLDDRNVAPASSERPDTFIWTRESNALGWQAYLGRAGGSADVSAYAAAMRATDLARLPPAYIAVGTLDLFLQENITYAQRLIAAGVPTELHVYPGAFHGFDDLVQEASVSLRFKADRDAALKRAFVA